MSQALRRGSCLLGVLIAMGAGRVAAAQPAASAKSEAATAGQKSEASGAAKSADLGTALTGKARSLHLEGIQLFQQGKLAEARAALAAAWGIKKHYHIAGALGSVELALKHFRESATLLHYYMQKAPDSDEKKKTEKNYLAAVAKVGKVRLVIQPVGGVVKLDGKVLDKQQLAAVFVDPGKHEVELTAAGRERTKGSFSIGAGEEKKVQLRAKKSDAPPPKQPPPAWIGWAMGGAGVAGLAAGATLMVLSAGKYSDAEALSATVAASGGPNACGGSTLSASCLELKDATRASDGLKTGGVIALASGGALLAGGALYLLLRPSAKTAKKSASAGLKPKPSWQLRPLLGRTNGAMLHVRF